MSALPFPAQMECRKCGTLNPAVYLAPVVVAADQAGTCICLPCAWAGNWQCRNWQGYLQHREGARGNWCFIIDSFGGDPDGDGTAWVLKIEGKEPVPIDRHNRLLTCGRRYGRSHWHH